jgi:pentatricopeptide repeat protein
MASHGVDFTDFANDIKVEVLQILEAQYGGEQGRTEFLKKLGSSYADAVKDPEMLKFDALQEDLSQPTSPLLQAEPTSLSASPTYSSSCADSESTLVPSSPSGLMVHGLLTRTLQELLNYGSQQKAKLAPAYRLFQKNLSNRMVPEPSAIAALIQAFGRAGDLEKVRELYTVAQEVFPLLDRTVQLDAWAHVEDRMIIALAHAGFPDAAHVHRMRILDQGLTPSADAYGVLIQHVKDTTDDTSGAMALFREAQERGVKMNLYLYNNIISKLSKARKADYALELFQQMKASYVVPSSITYGAVIGACARVGDVRSAGLLFQEMVHSKNFKPRVPPYNTMMQLHTTTKPNRISALHYYNEMRQAGVQPSAHTYKVRLMPDFINLFLITFSFTSFFSIPMVPLSPSTSQPWKTSSTNCKTTCLSN